MKQPCNFLILIEFACMLIISCGVIIYLYIQELPNKNYLRNFFLETQPQIDYFECNLSFDGNLNHLKSQNVTKLSKDEVTEICLSNEQIRIFDLTKNLRPRLSTNYSGYMGPWVEDGVFCNWIEQYSTKRIKKCNISEPIPPVYIPIFWTSIQRNKVDVNIKKEWQIEAQDVLNSLKNETLYFTVLQVSFKIFKTTSRYLTFKTLSKCRMQRDLKNQI